MADKEEIDKSDNGSDRGDAAAAAPPSTAPDPSADADAPAEADEPSADSEEAANSEGDAEQPAAETAEPVAADEAAEAEEPSAEPTLEERLEAAEKKAAVNKERLLRVAADFDNFRKRSARDVELARQRGKQAAVRELLPVFDNLERAAGLGAEAVDAKGIADGVRIVLKMFVDSLGKLDIERIDALGAGFDPMIHEGIQHDFSDEYEAGTVMAVFHPGYRMGKDLLRPALVVVSRGPKPAEPAAEAQAADTTEDDEPAPTEDEGDGADEAPASGPGDAPQDAAPEPEDAPAADGDSDEGDDEPAPDES